MRAKRLPILCKPAGGGRTSNLAKYTRCAQLEYPVPVAVRTHGFTIHSDAAAAGAGARQARAAGSRHSPHDKGGRVVRAGLPRARHPLGCPPPTPGGASWLRARLATARKVIFLQAALLH
jgi:hypothetical protein